MLIGPDSFDLGAMLASRGQGVVCCGRSPLCTFAFLGRRENFLCCGITAFVSDHLPAEVAEALPFTDGLGPMQRWAGAREEPETATVILQRVADGETLKGICRSRGWPYSLVAQWLHGDAVLLARYDAALQLWVDSIAMETVAISDEQAAVVTKNGEVFDPDVPRDALRIKARQWAAERLHRARYGQTLKVERSVRVEVDAGLVGFASDLLELMKPAGKDERVVSEVPAAVGHEMI